MMNDELITRTAVMESLTKEYNRRGTGDGLKLAWIEKAVSDTPSAQPEPCEDTISRQAVFDIVDDLRDRMTVVGYWSVVERIKALPSATCGNLEKPEIPQHSEGEAADCNLDCISRQMLLEYIHGEPVGKLLCDKYNLDGLIEQFPSAQPNFDITVKIDKAYDDGHETGYLQGRHDWGDLDE